MNAKAANGGAELSAAQVDELTGTKHLTLSPSLVTAAPDYKSAKDITVSDTGADALKAFAANAEAIILKNKSASDATKDEILYLQDAVERMMPLRSRTLSR